MEIIKREKKLGVFINEIDKRLSWSYPYKEATLLPVKLSVTELKRMKDEEEEYVKELFRPLHIKKPRFLEEEKTMGAAKRGSIMHFVMQHLDLTKPLDTTGIKVQIERLVTDEYMTSEEAKAVNIGSIVRFFESDLGQRMLKADKVFREKTFNIEISPEEVFPGDDYINLGEKILLQGIIDCYFIENDRIILADYKTDYIDGDEKEIAVKRYKTQIDYYSKALETILDKKVAERYIYFFHTGNAVRI